MSFLKDIGDSLTHPGDLKKGFKGFKAIDPVLTFGVEKGMSAEDSLLSKTWKGLGNDDMAEMFDKDSDNSGRAGRRRIGAGALVMAGMAIGAGMGAGGAAGGGGGGAAAGGGGAGGATGGGTTAASTSKFGSLFKSFGGSAAQMGQQRQAEREPVDQMRANFDANQYAPVMVQPGAQMAYSSKKLKEPAEDTPMDVNDPIDRNGMEMLSIQELTKRIASASSTLAKLKKERHVNS